MVHGTGGREGISRHVNVLGGIALLRLGLIVVLRGRCLLLLLLLLLMLIVMCLRDLRMCGGGINLIFTVSLADWRRMRLLLLVVM